MRAPEDNMRSAANFPRWVWLALLLLVNNASASQEELVELRPKGYKKWRKNPKMVVFSDSTGDSGRRLKAPASFDFEGIGVFPWKRLYKSNDTEEKFRAYLPSPGAVTNGKAWPEWLRIPDELNYATSSASMTAKYRSRQSCTGYKGEGEDFPTGTLNEQIDLYLNDIACSDETLDYTHSIFLGTNDIRFFFGAVERYQIGAFMQSQGAFRGNAYEDPVAYDQIFKIVNGDPQVNVELLITEVIMELTTGVQRLLASGVTGRILIGNIPSFRGLQEFVLSDVADSLDEVALAMNAAIDKFVSTRPQLRLIDVYTLFAAVVDEPGIFEELGYREAEEAPEGHPIPLGIPCLQLQFSIDDTSDIMGTQAFRAAGCQEECDLCANDESPCRVCFEGNPSATICDDPDSRIFWDFTHPTTSLHLIFGEAVRQCSKDHPKYDRPFVQILCPGVK